MDFPLSALMDEQACYDKLVTLLHPQGLRCPDCGRADALRIHGREREPVVRYRCHPNAARPGCGRSFTAFSGTVLARTDKKPSVILLLLRGFAQGVPTAKLARELNLARPTLHVFRRRVQQQALLALPTSPLPDAVVESDEMYQNAGEKRRSASRSGRPAPPSGQQNPRARQRGHRPAARVRHDRS